MTTALDAWLEGQYVGQFREDDTKHVTFVYDESAPETPISLSLPRDRPATRKAAKNLLDNFLPDHKETRARMARVYGADSDSTFDMLAKSGGDVAGGLVLLPAGQTLESDVPELNPALDRDIAERIAAIKRDPDAWVPTDAPARFSLAGTQGKFALALIEDEWYWSNATVPSTHILKPGRPDVRGLEAAEAAALRLAGAVGLNAPDAIVLHAVDQTSYMVQRFDRLPGKPIASRLHAEDLAQASGTASKKKYGMSAAQALAILGTQDEENHLALAFVGQLAFNVMIGNADAHAKNYSILLRPSGVELAPMYDVIPIGLYPQFDQNLAMKISGSAFPQEVTMHHWKRFAETANLDPDEVASQVAAVAEGILENLDTAWVDLDQDHQSAIKLQLQRNTDKIV